MAGSSNDGVQRILTPAQLEPSNEAVTSVGGWIGGRTRIVVMGNGIETFVQFQLAQFTVDSG